MRMISGLKAGTMEAKRVLWNKIKIAVVAARDVTASAIVIFNLLVRRFSTSLALT